MYTKGIYVGVSLLYPGGKPIVVTHHLYNYGREHIDEIETEMRRRLEDDIVNCWDIHEVWEKDGKLLAYLASSPHYMSYFTYVGDMSVRDSLPVIYGSKEYQSDQR